MDFTVAAMLKVKCLLETSVLRGHQQVVIEVRESGRAQSSEAGFIPQQ